MMEWGSYQLQDFIPFTEEVYFRLIERTSETFWPLHLPALTLGALILALAVRARGRSALLLLVPVWCFVAVAFFLHRYAQLNWAGDMIAWAFLAESLMLFLAAILGQPKGKTGQVLGSVRAAGFLVVAYGLVGHPVATLLAGGSWFRAEVFGIHPDPTVIASTGLIIMLLRGSTLFVLLLVPVAWSVISVLTLIALASP